MIAPNPPGPKYRDSDLPHNTQFFIAQIEGQLKRGYGFVPLIGAGFSAPSGAPLIVELKEYLQRCICISLGIDGEDTIDNSVEILRQESGNDSENANSIDPWNPRTDKWPPFVDRSRVFPQGYWGDLLFKNIIALDKDSKKEGFKDWKTLELLNESYGAMQDWRTALLFLSRLNRKARSEQGAKSIRAVWLDVPQQEVIDACFREVLRGKMPTLGQRMLAVLAGVMRIDIILTTNFDDLLERAFAVARVPLEVFEVTADGNLPDRTALSNVRSLIKLHGGHSELRANYSLDQEPTTEDKRIFLHYLLSAKGRKQYTDYIKCEGDYRDATKRVSPGFDFQNHIIVIGFSGTDRRINAFIEYAKRHLDNKFRVYWVCYSTDDVNNINAFNGSSAVTSSDRDDYTILRHTESGLFLLHIYQLLQKTLPPLGGIFPSVSRLTTPPLEPKKITDALNAGERTQGAETFMSTLKKQLSNFDQEGNRLKKVILVGAEENTSGFVSLCARVYRELNGRKYVCLWIDMNDVSSADNLYEVLLESIYYRLGLEDWIPATMNRREEEIDRLARSVNKRWVVFLNGYETPGSNTTGSDTANPDWTIKNDPQWHEGEMGAGSYPTYTDKSACGNALASLLEKLCAKDSRLSIVMITPDNNFSKSFNPKKNLMLRTWGIVCNLTDASFREVRGRKFWLPITRRLPNTSKNHFAEITLKFTGKDNLFTNPDKTVDAVWNWVGSDSRKKRFLYAMVLMQRPRLLASIWSDALSPQPSTKDEAIGWVDELEERGLVRRKPGGMIWVNSRCREVLRTRFGAKRPVGICAKSVIHRDIAHWYEKILDASESPVAVFEAAYHFCEASLAFLESEKYHEAETNIQAASSVLRANALLIQTHGYSRGSCRRLEMVAGVGTSIFALANQKRTTNTSAIEKIEGDVRKLWVICTEVMRAVAREVGEDGKAYYRLRQLRYLDAGYTWQEAQEEKTDLSISILKTKPTQAANGTCPDAKWLRWWRWSSMLAIASRSYAKAEKNLQAVLGEFDNIEQGKDNSTSSNTKYRIFFDTNPQTAQKQRIELLRMIEQSAELCLLQYSLSARLANGADKDDECAKYLSSADKLIKRGTKLAQKISASDQSGDSHELILANWSQIRLLMHRSVVASRVSAMRSRGYGQPLPFYAIDAMGILSDAEAKLRISDARRFRAENAMIDLHRADAKLCEAENIDISDSNSVGISPAPLFFANFLVAIGPDTTKDELSAKVDAASLTKAGALVMDCIKSLDRAEDVLRDRRRNVWWTTWFFERKLRAIGMAVAAAALDTGTPIPFLGLEAAMRKTDTEADRLLNDAIRMIRVDAYRLATIIDAYITCINALNACLQLDNTPNELLFRRRLMYGYLEKAQTALTEVNTERATYRTSSATMDTGVQALITKVEGNITATLPNRP